MPESLQGSERGEKVESNIGLLEDQISSLEDVPGVSWALKSIYNQKMLNFGDKLFAVSTTVIISPDPENLIRKSWKRYMRCLKF
eukprot:gene21297-27325_t